MVEPNAWLTKCEKNHWTFRLICWTATAGRHCTTRPSGLNAVWNFCWVTERVWKHAMLADAPLCTGRPTRTAPVVFELCLTPVPRPIRATIAAIRRCRLQHSKVLGTTSKRVQFKFAILFLWLTYRQIAMSLIFLINCITHD